MHTIFSYGRNFRKLALKLCRLNISDLIDAKLNYVIWISLQFSEYYYELKSMKMIKTEHFWAMHHLCNKSSGTRLSQGKSYNFAVKLISYISRDNGRS